MRIATLACLLVLATPAAAIDFTKPVLGLDGKPISDCPAEKPACGEILTLSKAATIALTLQPNVAAGEKFRRFRLAEKIFEAKDASLKAEEISLIKEAAAATMTPIVVGRIYEAVDPQETK